MRRYKCSFYTSWTGVTEVLATNSARTAEVNRRSNLGGVTDMTARIGSVTLPGPVMTAAGTSGHGAELHAYFDLASIGAVTVKSLSAKPHAGNPSPRVHELRAGMINAIGLQNAGVEDWIENDLPRLKKSGARIIASIWGFTLDEFAATATALKAVADDITALEVNISCPNTEMGGKMFAHDKVAAAEVIAATDVFDKPRWAKLSPNTTELIDIAGVCIDAGAESLTLTNTLIGMAIDTETGKPRVSNGTGGVSGSALHNVAVRCVYQVRAAYPEIGIVGVGGISTATDAVEFMMAGANAVQVGTATFENPRAPQRIARELEAWCASHDVERVANLTNRSQ